MPGRRAQRHSRRSRPVDPAQAGDRMNNVYRTISLRVLPILFVSFLFNFLDRVNVGFANLSMSSTLGMDSAAYGFGAGLFFVGYFFFEIPSNLALYRFGARIWIARIVFSWGVLTTLTAFVSHPWQFYTLRFLLGAAEAGFFPGIILVEDALRAEEDDRRRMGAPESALSGLRNTAVWKLCAIYFCQAMGLYGITFWLPEVIKELGWNNPAQIGFITAIPWTVAVILMFLFSTISDRFRARRVSAISADSAARPSSGSW
jgi:MFS family permease